jgi:hypothetical protein
MGIEYVDGRRYGKAVIAGAEWVLHTREHLNRINVFADGDTGTNLALSLAATASAVRHLDERDLGLVAGRVAEAGILGAKGNSGLLMAHWFLGIARRVEKSARVDAQGLADALSAAAGDVHAAVADPVEGTILTVMRAASETAGRVAQAGHDVERLLDEVLRTAEESLARTPDLLPALKEANVVDAGAAGWVNFMHGVRRAIRGEPPPDWSEQDLQGTLGDPHPEHLPLEEITERYCTELICRGSGFDAARIRRLFADDGTYLLVAATDKVFKLHIHTNHPEGVFRKAERLGRLEERKVDDMLRQRDERAEHRPPADLSAQPDTVAIVTDSTADLPAEVREKHGIELVPLQVLFGDEVFRDQVDLDTETFYRRLAAGESPTTSQPPPRAFVEALERVRPDRSVVVLTLAGSLSGTHRSATSGVRLAPHPRVEVVDSRSASVGLGLMAVGAARLAERGASVEEIVRAIEHWRDRTSIVFSVASLEYLKRGGRISAAQALIGNVLGLRPVLHWNGEKISSVARSRGEADAFRKVIRAVEGDVPPGKRIRIGLVAAADVGDRLAAAERELRERWDVAEVLHGGITGVIGTHTGPGTWAVIVQRVDPDDPLA